MKYDWDRIIKDEVLCKFWDFEDGKVEVGILHSDDGRYWITNFYLGEKQPKEGFTNCEPYHTEDKEKYAIEEEKEPEYRACESHEEFAKFMLKLARKKDVVGSGHLEIIAVSNSMFWKWFHTEWELVEPLDGSTVIGVLV